jgi:hypothetical protein
MRKAAGSLSLFLSLAACATTPDVNGVYFLPKAQTDITVTQVMGCTAAKNLIVTTSVVPATTYSANLSAPERLPYAKMSGFFADADATGVFANDGMLQSVNATTAGQASAIVKSVIGLAPPLTSHLLTATPTDIAKACETIANFTIQKPSGGTQNDTSHSKVQGSAPKDTSSVLTLSYERTFAFGLSAGKCNAGDYDLAVGNRNVCLSLVSSSLDVDSSCASTQSGGTRPICSGADSFPAFSALSPPLGEENLRPTVKILNAELVPIPVEAAGEEGKPVAKSSSPQLTLNRVAIVTLEVDSLALGQGGTSPELESAWKGSVRVPLSGSNKDTTFTYQVPIPSSQFFGKTQFAIAVAGDGSITKLEYGKTNGVGDALNTATNLTQYSQGPTDQQRADAIYQQQRLVLCETTPKSCPK